VLGQLGLLYGLRARARAALGRREEALADLARARVLLSEAGQAGGRSSMPMLQLVVLGVAILHGDAEATLGLAHEFMRAASEYGTPTFLRLAPALLASAALLAGDRQTARDAIDRLPDSFSLPMQIDLSLRFDEPPRVIAEARESLQRAQQRALLWGELSARFALARGLVANGEHASPELDAALEPVPGLIEHTGLVVLGRELHEVRALRAAARGDAAEQRRELERALAVARETGCHGHAARLERELAS
jgi:hypothetical protein